MHMICNMVCMCDVHLRSSRKLPASFPLVVRAITRTRSIWIPALSVTSLFIRRPLSSRVENSHCILGAPSNRTPCYRREQELNLLQAAIVLDRHAWQSVFARHPRAKETLRIRRAGIKREGCAIDMVVRDERSVRVSLA